MAIPEDAKIYTKIDNSDSTWLYYKENNQLVRISTDDPWIRRTATMPDTADSFPALGSMAQTLNVCDEWAKKLNTVLADTLNGYTFSVDPNGEKYELKNGTNSIDTNDIFLNNNFSTTMIEIKLGATLESLRSDNS